MADHSDTCEELLDRADTKAGNELLMTERLNTGSIDKWLIFSLLPERVVSNIRMACVFGRWGNETVFVTKDDEVMSLGSNSGLGCIIEVSTSLEPKKIDQLSKKGVIKMSFGFGPNVVAMTSDGDVWTWGQNDFHQLGNGSIYASSFPQQLTSLMGRVIDIACGSNHTLVLTRDGEVYSWGLNNCGQIGSGTTTNQPRPHKVMASVIGSRRVQAIACGERSSMAVLETGEVLGWGLNDDGQLGIGDNNSICYPKRVLNLDSVVIKKVVCGAAHTLLLSDDGFIYSFGSNTFSQLGTGTESDQTSPVRIAQDLGRFVDIAATHYNDISAALSDDKKVYMWGQCRKYDIITPMETPFQSIDDVFAACGTPAVTFRPLELSTSPVNRVLDSLSQAFDDERTYDFKFIVEGKPIHVHKAILRVRCEHFRSMFGKNWEESDKSELQMSQYSYPVYHAFLQYLYTGEVMIAPEEGIGLLDLANYYCESNLKQKCERLIRNGITIDNVAMLYSAAIKFDAKGLEEHCFRFALAHLTAVVQTEAFQRLDESMFKNFIRKAGQNGAFRH